MILLKRFSLITSFIFSLLFVGCSPQSYSATEYTVQVQQVVDGDTITLKKPVLGTKKVRLVSIDAPETNYNGHSQSPWGEQAKKELHSLLPQGTTIVIQTDKEEKDNYGRLLAYIMKDNININKVMLEKGFAVTYYLYPNLKYFKEFQTAYVSAKKNGKGIWNPNNPLAEHPFEFRLRISNKTSNKYVGNYYKKEYVVPEKYKQIPVENRVFFFRESDAISAGYKKSNK